MFIATTFMEFPIPTFSTIFNYKIIQSIFSTAKWRKRENVQKMHSIHANNETCCIHRYVYTNMFVNNYLVGYTKLHIFIVGEIIEVSIKRSNNSPY